MTTIMYWILVADGGAWMDTTPGEIQRLMADGFTPVIRITAAL